MRRSIPPISLLVGLTIIAVCQGLLYVDVQRRSSADETDSFLLMAAQWVAVNMTVLCWVGYLLILDGVLHQFWRGRRNWGSPIRQRPNRFMVAWLTSIPIWCFFDFLNFYYIDAWRYHGLPESFLQRLPGYLIAIACISPGMFLTAEIFQRLGVQKLTREGLTWLFILGPAVLIGGATLWLLPRAGEGAMAETRGVIGSALLLLGPAAACLLRKQSQLVVAGAIGLGFTGWALLVQQPLACMTLWVGLIYLIDPINAKLGAPSLLRDWQAGRLGRTASLCLGGAVCGLLWEFWNYYAIAKWTYSLPFLGDFESYRYFEMPWLGFIGFLPFAAECWVVLNLIIALLDRLGCRVAEPLPDKQSVV